MSVLAQWNQETVDKAAGALIQLLSAMGTNARAEQHPVKWDDEYAGYAIDQCIDRLFCAPEAGMPKPSDDLRDAYHGARRLAAPFLDEDVPLPGSLEDDVLIRCKAMYTQRWPEGEAWERLRFDDPIRQAIVAEATRDAEAARS